MKKYIAILLFFLIDILAGYILYTKAWVKFDKKTIQPPPLATPIQQKKFSYNIYSDPQMNLSFNYPTTFKITQVRPHLISLSNPSTKTADSSLYIFETMVASNTNVVDIPFVTNGKIKSQVAIPIKDFTAKQITYTDGLILITLRKNQQFIMIRIPKDSKNVGDAITDFVDTVKTF